MKVAIVGGSPSTQMLAPFDDEEWEIWVLGNQLDQYNGKRITRIFEIHDNLSEHDPKYPQWLVSHNIKMVVGDKFPITEDHVSRFPVEDVNKLLGEDLLSSSPAYMIALAILENANEIAIYGVDMAVDNHEYFKQRPEMYAWIAYAKAKEIKVIIPEQSPLFKGGYIEGRDWNNVKDTPFDATQFEQLAELHKGKTEEYNQKIRELEVFAHSHDGARQVYERLAKVARSVDAGIKINLIDTVKVN